MNSIQINVLGMELSFRSGAELQRFERARDFVESEYGRLKKNGGQFSKERLLTLLILGIADDLLQSQQEIESIRQRLGTLLKHIEKTD